MSWGGLGFLSPVKETLIRWQLTNGCRETTKGWISLLARAMRKVAQSKACHERCSHATATVPSTTFKWRTIWTSCWHLTSASTFLTWAQNKTTVRHPMCKPRIYTLGIKLAILCPLQRHTAGSHNPGVLLQEEPPVICFSWTPKEDVSRCNNATCTACNNMQCNNTQLNNTQLKTRWTDAVRTIFRLMESSVKLRLGNLLRKFPSFCCNLYGNSMFYSVRTRCDQGFTFPLLLRGHVCESFTHHWLHTEYLPIHTTFFRVVSLFNLPSIALRDWDKNCTGVAGIHDHPEICCLKFGAFLKTLLWKPEIFWSFHIVSPLCPVSLGIGGNWLVTRWSPLE